MWACDKVYIFFFYQGRRKKNILSDNTVSEKTQSDSAGMVSQHAPSLITSFVCIPTTACFMLIFRVG